LIFQSTPTKSKFNNPHSLKHSNKHIVSNNSRDKFWEQKSLKFNAPYTNIIKKKKITQHKNMEGLNKKQNPIWQSREERERERERTCGSAGSTVGFGPIGFSSISPHPVKAATPTKYIYGPNCKTPWLFRINRPLLRPISILYCTIKVRQINYLNF